MANITYVAASGLSTTVDLPDGWNLMQGAITHGIEGILGDCGGSCVCATCHCYVEASRLDDLPPASDTELDMLSCVAAERKPNSRLACQLQSSPQLEGLVLNLPATQA